MATLGYSTINEFVSDPQVIGAAFGTAGGALLGSLLAGKGKRGKGALIGSLLGLGPGWYIGRKQGQLADEVTKANDEAAKAKNEAGYARYLADKTEHEKRMLEDDLDRLRSIADRDESYLTPDEYNTLASVFYGHPILSKIDGMKKLRDKVRSIK